MDHLNHLSCQIKSSDSGLEMIPYTEGNGYNVLWKTAVMPREWQGWAIFVRYRDKPRPSTERETTQS
ncbi:hypothetical protein ACFL6U_26865 [Planctomycetota bacterium]